MEGQESQPTEKAYCCSNYPQTEASLIAKFDLVVGAIAIVSVIVAISVVASEDIPVPTAPSPTPHQNPGGTTPAPAHNATIANDPSMFFYWPKEKQLMVLSFMIVGRALGVGFTVLLLIGVKKKNHGYLLTWFIFTMVNVVILIVSGIVLLVLASDKLLLGIVVVTVFLYNWYCLWIVKLLMSEIRAVREGYANPLDDGEIENVNNLVPSSDSFTVDKF